MSDVLYLCDRKACEHCSPECNHTADILHARNFEKGMDGKTLVEASRPIAFLKTNCRMKRADFRKLRNLIDVQLPTGVVILPTYIEPVIASTDGKEHPVKFLEEVDLYENFKQTYLGKQVDSCDICKHQHKETCPASEKGYSLDKKPYFERKW